jgi:hypothetical protein
MWASPASGAAAKNFRVPVRKSHQSALAARLICLPSGPGKATILAGEVPRKIVGEGSRDPARSAGDERVLLGV